MTQFGCTGPCDQGRKPCPTPDACNIQEDEPPAHDIFKVVMKDLLISVGLVGSVVFVLWLVLR